MSSPESDERRNAIPIIYTSGTHYEVGFNVGSTFRGQIQDYLGSSSWIQEMYSTKAGRAAYEETLASLKENYPQYIREMQGTADGAQVPFHHLMLLHMDRTVSVAGEKEQQACSSGLKGCSTLSINGEDQVLLGHTEDGHKDILNRVYLVSATISEKEPQGKLGTQRESFTALCYPGDLPGACMGYNHHGLVFSVNSLCPQKVIPGRTPPHFLCRALLSATSAEEAHNILRDNGTGTSDGISINMVFMRQKDNHIFQSMELGPSGDNKESLLSVVTLNAGQHYFHTNKYLHLTDAQEEDSISLTSSNHRHARANQFPAPKSLHDMLELLSDTEDSSYPIFREKGTARPNTRTLALGVFDLVKKTWTMWMKNPRKATPVMEIPLHFNWNS